MRRLIFLVSVGCAFGLWAADPLPATVVNAVDLSLRSSARWEMTKIVAGANLRLASSGTVKAAADRTIEWKTETPFASEVFLSPETMKLVSEGATNEVKVAELPHYAQIASIVERLLRANDVSDFANWKTLPSDEGKWKIHFTVTQGRMARFITEFTLAGSAKMELVQISFYNGDRTEIRFAPME